MSVLLDVLNIAREKHYMVLDPVQTEPPEAKLAFQLLAKKKVLLIHIGEKYMSLVKYWAINLLKVISFYLTKLFLSILTVSYPTKGFSLIMLNAYGCVVKLNYLYLSL